MDVNKLQGLDEYIGSSQPSSLAQVIFRYEDDSQDKGWDDLEDQVKMYMPYCLTEGMVEFEK